jgi:ubiquinone/menaquinone biosynthesis C-methylase UbiE
MSTEKIYQAVLQAAREAQSKQPLNSHLDIGAGSGRLIGLLHDELDLESSACDYTDGLMEREGQRVDVVDLNEHGLLYPSGSYDIVTATEVIEHLKDYRRLLSDIHRVLVPGGTCILSTPNVLNLNSRLRYLWFGFPELFGPIPIRDKQLQSTGRHISPISYFYLAHALLEAGFSSLALRFDKYQRSGMVKLLFFWLPLKVFGGLARRKEVMKYKTVDLANRELVKNSNTLAMLLGRTIIVSARKRPVPPSDGKA